MNENELKAFGNYIQRLINKENLSKDEACSLFLKVLRNEQPDLQQGALLAALVSKGETAQEIAGAWEAIDTCDTVHATVCAPGVLVENSGTGMDSLKTFNVSSAAGIVAAACGVTLARHGARALTSFCGTVDILESIGLDVECDIEVVVRSIECAGIGLFNGMSPKIHPVALGRILSQIRFGSTLNIAASLANPARPAAGLRGVYAEAIVPLVAQVMREIGYKKGMVVHGKDDHRDGGMDELSVTGETVVRTFAGGQTEDFRIRPEDIGLPTARFEEIASTNDIQKESRRFIQVLAGKGHDACVNFTCLNASAILVVAEVAKDLRDGIAMSREAILSGTAVRKLRAWIAAQNRDPERGLKQLSKALSLAGVSIN
ncbi:MAG: anthranilate phosphoribosyltransferase [Kiritimatiellae bacterium]|nr:anthranilate phosphoribosyltransferase [Kiritimatiellia bacterium]